MHISHEELVTDAVKFSALRAECDAVFDTNQRLPGKVFRKKYTKYYAFEHRQVFRNDFAIFLTKIARSFADSSVNYITIDPDPVEYYRKNCGFYGLASFKSDDLIDSYLKVMFRNGSADSFRARGGDIGAIWGSSLNWGIFCDRVSWDVCLMGASFGLDNSLMSAVGCMSADQLEAYLLSQYKDRPIFAAEFLKQFHVNYS